MIWVLCRAKAPSPPVSQRKIGGGGGKHMGGSSGVYIGGGGSGGIGVDIGSVMHVVPSGPISSCEKTGKIEKGIELLLLLKMGKRKVGQIGLLLLSKIIVEGEIGLLLKDRGTRDLWFSREVWLIKEISPKRVGGRKRR